MELDDDDLGVLHAGGSPSGMADLVKDKIFHELNVIDGVIELLHDLDIAEIDHVRLGDIHDEENIVGIKGSDGRGVLADDLAIEGSVGGLHEGVAVEELDGDDHGGENIEGLDGNLVEGIGDNGGVDAMGEEGAGNDGLGTLEGESNSEKGS